ncbi:MAG: glycosyltransferase family 2 protein [Spirulinaceae cyanobacterium]
MNLNQLPFVSIIIINYNGAEVILNCLESLYSNLKQVAYEVIVVDNASQDGSPESIVQQFPQVTLLPQKRNLGFGSANNIGVQQAQGEFLFLLNSDTIITADILPRLIAKLNQSPLTGIVGPQLLNPDGSFQFSVSKEISILGEFQTLQQVKQYRNLATRPNVAKIYNQEQNVDIVVGAAMLMRRSLFKEVGGFDQSFFMYFEESDLCKRVGNLGYSILYIPEVSLIHLGGYSVAKNADYMAREYRRSQRYYYKKHRPLWEQWFLYCYLIIRRIVP